MKVTYQSGTTQFRASLRNLVEVAIETIEQKGQEDSALVTLQLGEGGEYIAVAHPVLLRLMVAGNCIPSEYLAPLTAREYLKLYPLDLPSPWIADIVPCTNFEIEDDGAITIDGTKAQTTYTASPDCEYKEVH